MVARFKHVTTELRKEFIMAEKKKMLAASFRHRADARLAYDWLLARGYHGSHINALMSDSTRNAFVEEEEPIAAGSHALEGVAAGGAIGTAVGATLGALTAAATSIVLPGIGLVIAGPIVAALAGGGAGAVAGGVLGGLIGLGIPESNAKAYEAVLREGGVVLGVTPKSSDDADEIEEYFKDNGGENIVYA